MENYRGSIHNKPTNTAWSCSEDISVYLPHLHCPCLQHLPAFFQYSDNVQGHHIFSIVPSIITATFEWCNQYFEDINLGILFLQRSHLNSSAVAMKSFVCIEVTNPAASVIILYFKWCICLNSILDFGNSLIYCSRNLPFLCTPSCSVKTLERTHFKSLWLLYFFKKRM